MAEPFDEGQGLRNLGGDPATDDDVVADELTEGDFTEQEKALLKRVDELIAVHGGDLRAVIETLLMAYDDRVEQVSFGFVRGRGRGG